MMNGDIWSGRGRKTQITEVAIYPKNFYQFRWDVRGWAAQYHFQDPPWLGNRSGQDRGALVNYTYFRMCKNEAIPEIDKG